MGDVVTALGRAVQEEDHDVMVVLPKYDVLNYEEARPCPVPCSLQPSAPVIGQREPALQDMTACLLQLYTRVAAFQESCKTVRACLVCLLRRCFDVSNQAKCDSVVWVECNQARMCRSAICGRPATSGTVAGRSGSGSATSRVRP